MTQTRPELKVGLMEESPLEGTEEGVEGLESVETDLLHPSFRGGAVPPVNGIPG